MGTGVCSRRQKSLLHTGFCLLALMGLGTGFYFYNYMQNKARTSEAQAGKYKQQHETLSAQLQVVYEHRSRLERSLQKEKSEHKKTKEDYLVYKLEAQEALNKEKQDSMNRYGALSSQHKILKNQNEEIKKQLSDLQVEHSNLKLEHRKTVELNTQQLSQLQREKENEIAGLQDTILKLREESKLLRRAHQDVHTQLLSAQAQMEEFRQLKDALKKMPSFKDSISDTQHQKSLAATKKVPQNSQANNKNVDIPGGQGKRMPLPKGQENPLRQSPPVYQTHLRPVARNDSHVSRFTRTVNSFQTHRENEDQSVKPPDKKLQNEVGHDPPGVVDIKTPTVNARVTNEQVPIHSWQDIVNKVNARMTQIENKKSVSNALTKSNTHHVSVSTPSWDHGLPHQGHHKMAADDEPKMDAGMIDREETLQSKKQHVGQDTLISEDAADPAKDPNNQGEDEFEEAEIDRPEFEEKGEVGKNAVYQKGEPKMMFLQAADAKMRSREEPEEAYQDDQEQDIEERGGEPDNVDDLEHDEGADNIDEKNRRDGYY
ncbi:Golgi integral membrane protein 4-like isoform X2 [Hyla sarda]|uniref:Golgi integral membrane protein 4-like isoform X2 n=1 Tax=Hyla sarda TaxID=327740 RepID=UPI0024C42B58|nr:Golgi integral membrane protein 4-like isoform X2 [Hyla sarda]